MAYRTFTPGLNAYSQLPTAEDKRGKSTLTDPFGVNKNPAMGAMFNPIGEAMITGSPTPLLDPLGYAFGFNRPGTKFGDTMNKTTDPFKLFGGLKGLLG